MKITFAFLILSLALPAVAQGVRPDFDPYEQLLTNHSSTKEYVANDMKVFRSADGEQTILALPMLGFDAIEINVNGPSGRITDSYLKTRTYKVFFTDWAKYMVVRGRLVVADKVGFHATAETDINDLKELTDQGAKLVGSLEYDRVAQSLNKADKGLPSYATEVVARRLISYVYDLQMPVGVYEVESHVLTFEMRKLARATEYCIYQAGKKEWTKELKDLEAKDPQIFEQAFPHLLALLDSGAIAHRAGVGAAVDIAKQYKSYQTWEKDPTLSKIFKKQQDYEDSLGAWVTQPRTLDKSLLEHKHTKHFIANDMVIQRRAKKITEPITEEGAEEALALYSPRYFNLFSGKEVKTRDEAKLDVSDERTRKIPLPPLDKEDYENFVLIEDGIARYIVAQKLKSLNPKEDQDIVIVKVYDGDNRLLSIFKFPDASKP